MGEITSALKEGTGACKGCGAPTRPVLRIVKGRTHFVWCSENCRIRYYHYGVGIAPILCVCVQCNKEFAGRLYRKYCSDRCVTDYHTAIRRVRENWTVSDPRPCMECGKQFTPRPNNAKRAVRCSVACTRSFFTRQYRATQAQVTVEVVHPYLVFERDEWVCGICDKLIDRTVCKPHGMSPSLDHIVPLARGGAHSYANVQAAHLGCNRLKGSLIASH